MKEEQSLEQFNKKMLKEPHDIDWDDTDFFSVPLVLGDPYHGELYLHGTTEDEWLREKLGENAVAEVNEMIDKIKDYEHGKTLAIQFVYAKAHPGKWLETNAWVHFSDKEGNKKEYDLDFLADYGFEITENAQGYLCVRWPEEQ